MPQPNFVPFRFSTSRSTHKSGMSDGTSTVDDLPLTVSITLIEFSCPRIPYSPKRTDPVADAIQARLAGHRSRAPATTIPRAFLRWRVSSLQGLPELGVHGHGAAHDGFDRNMVQLCEIVDERVFSWLVVRHLALTS